MTSAPGKRSLLQRMLPSATPRASLPAYVSRPPRTRYAVNWRHCCRKWPLAPARPARTSISRSMTDQVALERAGFMRRHDCRFLWRNRGYGTFDDFLGTFRADKRKKVKRERRKVVESGISFRTLRGEEIDRATWSVIFGFSERTFLRHGNGHYLNIDFLMRVAGAHARHHHGQDGGARMASPSPPRFSSKAAAGSTVVTGARPGTRIRCISKLAITRASNTASSTAWIISTPARRANTRSRGASSPRARRPRTGSSTRDSPHAVGRYLERERAAIDAYIGSAQEHLPFQRGESA